MTARTSGDDGLIEALRARSDKGKESVSRDMAQDGRMSLKAAGLLLYLLSKPDRWRTNAQAIAKDRERDGRDAVSSGLRELEEFGYLVRKRRNAGGGRFVWCWIYSDDPADVVEALDVMFPERGQPDARRGRARAPKPRVGGKKAQAETRNGKPVHGANDPQVDAMNGFPVDGSAADGPAADGEPGDIESEEREITPPPPATAGGDVASPEEPPARCAEHGRTSCRPCGTSPRAREKAERDQAAAEAEAEAVEEARARRLCQCCDAEGWLLDPESGETARPARKCPHGEEAREAVDRAVRERDRATPDPDSRPREGSSAGREEVRRVLARKGPSKAKPPKRRLGRTRTFVPDGSEQLETSENVPVGEAV